MPSQLQLVLGVEGRTSERPWQVLIFVAFGQSGLSILPLSYIPMFSMENKIK